ncbi:hypothetical protein [Methanosphaera sp. WGK6]|uniref:hypothetical protein n=1 Tax=Methanosphaera sp. WGK6 TaxID=1561964 RepID=UPI00084C466B|nr:hypothetical protein [Methanosphaera sp. WGK6]OED30639.1 hypothetical protein NL43_01480 [Methanosphaera sp. WGK6]
MKLDNKWHELYEYLYGSKFNRLLTIGTTKNGYETFNIKSLNELKEKLDEYYPRNEFYISLYDYDSEESLLSWNRLDSNKFEKKAIKNSILFRFRQNTDIIREEIINLNDIQKFMFIRRSINLGSDKTIIHDVKKVNTAIKELFNIKPWIMFNGYNECYLYLFTNKLQLKNPTITYYYLYKFIETYTEITTLTYTQIEPFSQLVTLPGSQNNKSLLYAKAYDVNSKYLDIIKNSENKLFEDTYLEKNQDTRKLENLLKIIDEEITKQKVEGNNDVFNYNLDKLIQNTINS